MLDQGLISLSEWLGLRSLLFMIKLWVLKGRACSARLRETHNGSQGHF